MVSIMFEVDRQQYALPVACVHEVVLLPALVPLAGAPPHIRGMLNLRGHHVPILDGRALLGTDSEDRLDSQILILSTPDQQLLPLFGLLVDQVKTVRSVAPMPLNRLPARMAEPFLSGVMADGEASILVMDVEALMTMAGAHAGRNDDGADETN